MMVLNKAQAVVQIALALLLVLVAFPFIVAGVLIERVFKGKAPSAWG